MKKKVIKIQPSRAVYVDVDDTLIIWPGDNMDFNNHPEKIQMDCMGKLLTVIPHHRHIAILKRFYESGYDIVVWSASSKEWAQQAINKLGIEDWVDYCLSKPDFYIDDRDINHFILPEKRIYHKPE